MEHEKNIVFPDYNNSIVNLACTFVQFLGQKPQHAILPKLAEKLDSSYQNIIYLVVDGMGARILEKNLPVKSFLRQNQIQTVTSVFPSTTASATTSLITGLVPAEHGWFSWALNFNGEVVELFRNRNFYTKAILNNPHFVIEKLPYHNLWDNHNTSREIHTLLPKVSYKYSAPYQSKYVSLRQMISKLHKICNQPAKKFIYAYYPDLDPTMHHYGTTARPVKKLLHKLDRKIKKLATRHPETLFVITADHGQTDIHSYTYIYQDTEIQECLEHPIAWDSRATSFKVKPDCHERFQKAFQKYTQDYTLLTAEEAIQKGMFGKFQLRPDLRQYLGDYIAVGKDTGNLMVLKDPQKRPLNRGSHSGMTAEEIYVPVIVIQGGKHPKGE